jgi:hypothetical protein
MVQLRYIGSVEKTLIDVAALSQGKVFEIDDARAERLLNAFPGEYERVDGAAAPKARRATSTQEDTTGTAAEVATDESTST